MSVMLKVPRLLGQPAHYHERPQDQPRDRVDRSLGRNGSCRAAGGVSWLSDGCYEDGTAYEGGGGHGGAGRRRTGR